MRCATGFGALARLPVLRTTAIASSLATFGWGLMLVGFPLYAVRMLHAPAHTSGYLWAAVAGGSILGTFGWRGDCSLRRGSLPAVRAQVMSTLVSFGGVALAAGARRSGERSTIRSR